VARAEVSRRIPESLRQDLRQGIRRLRREPGLAATAVTTIGLAVGLITAVYSVASAVLLRPLPFAEPDRLVAIWRTVPGIDFIPVPIPEFLDLQVRSSSLEDLAGFSPDGRTVIAPGVTEWADVFGITPNLFDLLGVPAVVGRTSVGTGQQVDTDRFVVLAEGFWRRAFDADPAVVGTRIRLAGRDPSHADDSFEVLGVARWDMELSYRRPLRADVFVPRLFSPEERMDQRRRAPGLMTFGRLRPDVSVARGEADVRAIMTRLVAEYPSTSLPQADARVVPLHEELVGQARPALLLLGWGAGVVLLIACVNVTALFVASGVRRRREFIIRLSLGCPRRRLFRQVLTEHVLFAAFGGAAALLVAATAIPLIERLIPTSMPRADLIRVDAGALLFALAVSALAGTFSASLPAWMAARTRRLAALPITDSGSRTGRRIIAGLLVSQAALVLALLAGANLLTSSLERITALPLGFEPTDVSVMQIEVPRRLAGGELTPAFERDLLLRVRHLPGVERAATSDQLPFASGSLAAVSVGSADVEQPSLVSAVDPDYFQLLHVPLRQGRLLGESDTGRRDVALVNETLARLFPNEGALGARIRVAREWREVIGVVGDTTELGEIFGSVIRRSGALSRLTLPSAYVPAGTGSSASGLFLLARSSLPTADLALAVRREIGHIDSEVTIRRTTTLQARIDEASAGVRFQTLLAWVFAGIALVLATVGLYGVLSHAVGRRVPEIGLRVTLGATPGQVRWLVARRAVWLVGIGTAVGLAAVAVGGRVLTSFLFEVSPLDPAALAAAVAVLLMAAVVAAYGPVRRATRVDPAVALRSE